MELVYLWVEGYKNIEKQGFNFSPRFRCEFKDEYEKYIDTDGEEKERLKDNCELVIDENKDYVSIFPDNINITAIVGENGSGKSKLLNSFSSENTSIYCLYLNKNKLYKYTKKQKLIGNLIKPTNENKYDIKEQSENNFDIFAFNLSNELKDDYKRSSEYIKYYQVNDNDVIRSFFEYKFIKNYEMNLELLPFYFTPEFISIEPSIGYIEKICSYFNDSFSEYIKNDLLKNYYQNNYFLDNKIGLILFFIKEMININEKLEDKSQDYYWNFINKCKEVLTNENKLNFLEQIEILKSFDSKLKTPKEDYLKIEKYINKFYFYSIEELKKNNIFDLLIQKEYFELFDINFADTNKKREFFQLSTGEKKIFSFFVNLYEKINNSNKLEFILMFDEIEVYLHPNWQKKLLNLLVLFLKSNFDKKYKFHLIITSHSPFILSDLPKENIIFLEKGKQVYPFDDGKQTFGANIHTLLSHGFFMKDGLMGEFAKSKIDDVIKYLNQKTLTQEQLDYCENIIPIIGEPIIKRELQRKLDSKRLSKLDKIDEIEKQMKIMEEQRKLLEHRLELIRKNQK